MLYRFLVLQVIAPTHAEILPPLPEPESLELKKHLKQVGAPSSESRTSERLTPDAHRSHTVGTFIKNDQYVLRNTSQRDGSNGPQEGVSYGVCYGGVMVCVMVCTMLCVMFTCMRVSAGGGHWFSCSSSPVGRTVCVALCCVALRCVVWAGALWHTNGPVVFVLCLFSPLSVHALALGGKRL